MNCRFIKLILMVLSTTAIIATQPVIGADPPPNMGGWNTGSEYNKYYEPSEREKFKAIVKRLKTVVPLKGMSPGVAVMVQERGSEEIIEVHLCPEWYADKNDIGVKRGDRVKVYGSWAEINGKDVFMGAKIKQDVSGDFYQFKVRLTSDGTPFWTMTPEEREQHSK